MKRTFTLLILLSPLWSHNSAPAQPAGELAMNVLYFDGKTGYVQLPHTHFTHLTEATVEVWVRWERFNKWARVFDFGQKNNAVVVQSEKTSSTVNFRIWDTRGKRHGMKMKKAVTLGRWYHIAAVCGPGGMRFYINGTLKDRDKYGGGLEQVTGGQYYVGKSNWPKNKLFRGYMAEFRIWNRRLPRDEIASRMDRLLTGSEPGLVAYWRFDRAEASSLPDSGPSGNAATSFGGAQIMSVPAIARFLVPGELEKVAEDAYQSASDAFNQENYETAAEQFRQVLTYIADFKDAPEMADRAQKLADGAAALKHYTQGQAFMDQANYIPAYEAFKAALGRVPDYKDAPVRMQQTLDGATYSVGLFLFPPIAVIEGAPLPSEPEGGRMKRFWKWLGEAGRDDLLKKAEERKRVEDDIYGKMLAGLRYSKPEYVRLIDQSSLTGILMDRGVQLTDTLQVAQVVEAAGATDIPLVVLGEIVFAHLESKSSEKKETAYTVKKVTYTDEKGKKKKREEMDEEHTYKVREKSIELTCELRYKILDTTTGEILKGGLLSAVEGDQVEYAQKVKGVDPGALRLKSGSKFKKLSYSDKNLFDARRNLKNKRTLISSGTDQLGSELSGRILQVLETYVPPKPAADTKAASGSR